MWGCDVLDRVLQGGTYSAGDGGGTRGGDEQCGGDHERLQRVLVARVVLPVVLKRAWSVGR